MADEQPTDEDLDEAEPAVEEASSPDEPGDPTDGDDEHEETFEDLDRETLEETARTLREERDEAQAEADDLVDRLQRLKADFDNYRKRKESDVERARREARDDLLEELVDVLDSFDRGLEQAEDEAARQGILLIRKQFLGVLESHGVERVEPEGEDFDPREHEAVLREATDDAEPGTVLQVLEPGYVRGDETLRPARVKVASAPEAEADSS